MARHLHDFLDVHRGETAWLFGKGPGLDRFDMASAGPLRCAINDVVEHVPGCLYGFANDSVERWAHVYRAGQVLFQPLRLQHDIHVREVPVACERVWFPDDWADDRLAWPPARLAAEGLAVRRGTLGSAGQILRVMGVERVICVGIDGGGRHAARRWHTELRHDHAQDYNGIRDAFSLACRIAGLPVEFFGHPPDQLPHGMKTIKITEPCLVRGQHCSAGEVTECTPAEADLLVAEGRGVHWAPAAAPAIETAEARPAIEAPSAPARRSRLRAG